MQSANHHSESKCGACCPECTSTTPLHCAHCPQYRKAVAVHLEDGYDYRHLIGSPVKQHDKRFDAAQFDGLRTDYDRMLLRFGMQILWQ